jgi:hypothetical protein
MKFNELAGTADVDPLHAAAHITTWFNADDSLAVVGMRADRGRHQNVMAQVLTASEFVTQLRSPEGADLLQGLCLSPDGTRWQVYVSVAAVKGDKSLTKRGMVSLDQVARVPGLYVDLDVKPGSFESQEQALEFIRPLPEPALITASGSGGLHVWWKFSVPLPADMAAQIQRAWWAMLSEKAAPVFIDHLVDASRVMRLAGTVRWPKPDEDGRVGEVRVLHRNLQATHEPEKLKRLSRESAERREEMIRQTRARDAQRKIDLSTLGAGDWGRLMAIGNSEEIINDLLSWDEILTPAGWIYLREDRAGRREFARPGSSTKSATCDWPESPHVLSLHSWSPDTGLADLKEAGIVLTKYRVALRLLWHDDEKAMTDWILAQVSG